jgi:hypothetical protein
MKCVFILVKKSFDALGGGGLCSKRYCNIVIFRRFAVLLCHGNANGSWGVEITATTAKEH